MQRYAIAGADICEEHPDGKWVLHSDAQATIARLTAERDEARAAVQAAYERAAQVCDDVHIMLGDGPKRIIGEYQEDVQPLIRALATAHVATTALAELLDAETRACAEICEEYSKDHGSGMFDRHSAACAAAILARLDQRKEAGA